jgi:DNA-directed RNA polymerase specialized sigma24 family protein
MPATTSQAVQRPVETVEKRVVQAPFTFDFRAIYERWFEDISPWIRALGGPEAERGDLVQEVSVVVQRRLPHFDGQNVLERRPNESERAALVLFEIDGHSGAEIAHTHGVPVNTVWARIHKAREQKVPLARYEGREPKGAPC